MNSYLSQEELLRLEMLKTTKYNDLVSTVFKIETHSGFNDGYTGDSSRAYRPQKENTLFHLYYNYCHVVISIDIDNNIRRFECCNDWTNQLGHGSSFKCPGRVGDTS